MCLTGRAKYNLISENMFTSNHSQFVVRTSSFFIFLGLLQKEEGK